MALGIKNSWKYEKDLIIIFNPNSFILHIQHKGSLLISQPGYILLCTCSAV